MQGELPNDHMIVSSTALGKQSGLIGTLLSVLDPRPRVSAAEGSDCRYHSFSLLEK